MYFSDYFKISSEEINSYGTFNVSLIADLPLFIDPFLLFNSKKPTYNKLHDDIIKYLRFLKNKSIENFRLDNGSLKMWYLFPEVKNTWLGFTQSGNKGLGLGMDFARTLHRNLNEIFKEFGNEKITKDSHLEKLCLIEVGVGRDKISDFTTNFILDFLLTYTEEFTKEYINKSLQKNFLVNKVIFNYETETFEPKAYNLPNYNNSYVILIPKDMLTKDELWINKGDLIHDFSYYTLPNAIPDDSLRAAVNNYFYKILPRKPKEKDKKEAVVKTLRQYPELIDYYIRNKEKNGDKAVKISSRKIDNSRLLYINQFSSLIEILKNETDFYKVEEDSYAASIGRCHYLKDVIEHKNGHKIFYQNGKPIKKEEDLHVLYKLTWFKTTFDVSSEVNDGRGPADFKISKGSKDKTIVEFKLASNTQLKRNLIKQTELYKKSSDAKKDIRVIFYFNNKEENKVLKILNELNLVNKENIILVDAGLDNKTSASRA